MPARWTVLLLALLLSCRPSEEAVEAPGPPAAAELLGVSTRLAVEGEAPRLACWLAEETRPGFGCLEEVYLFHRSEREEAGVGIHSYVVPEALSGRRVVVARGYRRSGEKHFRKLPSLLLTLDRTRKLVPIDAKDRAEAKIRFFESQATSRERRTEAFDVAPGAVLMGGVGLDTRQLAELGWPVHFRIEARPEGAAEDGEPAATVWSRIVDPAAEGDRWLDYRVDLSRFAGQRVSLRMVTATEPGEGRRRGLSFPVWSVASVLEPRADREAPNLLVISLDTLRGDALGLLGSPVDTTPFIDAFAQDASVFEHAVSTWPGTTAAHMSLLTGTYPNVHRVIGPTDTLVAEIGLLQELLADAGMTTQAFTENGMIHAGSGFARGFDGYAERRGTAIRKTPGRLSEIVDLGLAWLIAHREVQSFLFLHSYEVHGPYTPSEDFDRFRDAYASSTAAGAHGAYAGEVAYADNEMKRLFSELRELGLLDRTIVVLTSDHGEGFGEHSLGHGETLHQPELHVPLVIRAPGRMPPGRYSARVSLVDLAPTVLDLLGLPRLPATQGRSLMDLRSDPSLFEARPVFAELGDSTAVWVGERKWIARPGEGVRAYDLASDPGERDPALDDGLGQELIESHARHAAEKLGGLGSPEAAPVVVDEETRLELEALGYLDPTNP